MRRESLIRCLALGFIVAVTSFGLSRPLSGRVSPPYCTECIPCTTSADCGVDGDGLFLGACTVSDKNDCGAVHECLCL
jgi:hypothetical protein